MIDCLGIGNQQHKEPIEERITHDPLAFADLGQTLNQGLWEPHGDRFARQLGELLGHIAVGLRAVRDADLPVQPSELVLNDLGQVCVAPETGVAQRLLEALGGSLPNLNGDFEQRHILSLLAGRRGLGGSGHFVLRESMAQL